MNSLKLILVLAVLALTGCIDKTKNIQNDVLDLTKRNYTKEYENKLDRNSVVDSTYFIKLETNEKSLIGKIGKVTIQDDYVFVFDKGLNQSILVFDTEGRFLNRIGTKGKGPGEYLYLGAYWIDRDKKIVCIYDRFKQSILKYSYDNEFIGNKPINKKLSYVPNEIKRINDSIYITYSYPLDNKDYLVNILNKEFEIKTKHFQSNFSLDYLYKPFISGFTEFENNEKINYRVIKYFSDTVYTLTDQYQLKPMYRLDLKLPSMKLKELKTIPTNVESLNNLPKYFKDMGCNTGVTSFYETKDHIFYTYMTEGRWLSNVIFFKNQNHVLQYSYLENSAGIEPIGNVVGTYKEYFVSSFEPIDRGRIISNFEIFILNKEKIKEMDDVEFPKLNMEFYKLLKSTKITDNPILVLTKYKDQIKN